jgi:PAS domain S-box-containing protein
MQLPIGQQIASAALLDAIFQDAPMVCHAAKADGSYATTYISPNVEKMLGCPPAEWLASPSYWEDSIHPEDLERVMRELAHLFETGRQIVEYRLLVAQGGSLWVKDEINLVRPPEGTPAYLLGYWYDISAHKHQEAALLEAQRTLQEKDQFLQSVLDNIPQRLFWKNRLSVFRGCNLAGARAVGLERPEDIEGKTDFNLHQNPMVADYLRNTDEAVMASGQAAYHAAVSLQQGEVWLDVTKVPLHDENGVVNGLLVSYEDVSAQKKTEIALRNFKRAVEQSSNTIIITNLDGDIEYVNPRFLEVYGYAEHEVLGKNPRLLKSVANSANTYQDLWQTIRGGKSWHGELVNQTKNGEQSWQSASISPIFDENGVITHFLAIQDDISDRKYIEEVLRQNEERFRTIANYTYNWESWIDPNGKLLWVNPGVERITGYTPDECYAMTDYPVGMVCPEDRAMVAQHFVGTLSGAGHRSLEFRILRKDGEVRWGEVSLQQVYDAGTSLGHRSSVRDITEYMQVMDSLHDTREMLQLVLDHIPQGIYWKDRNGTYLGGNAVVTRDTGRDRRNDIKGLTDSDLFSSEEAKRFRRYDLQVMNSDQALINYEEKFTNADGSERWVLTSKVPLHNRDGEVFGVLGTYTDITERKQAEMALQALNEMLEQRVKEETAQNMAQERLLIQQARHAAMGEMIGNIAHQWRQPLNTLGLIVQNIAIDYQDGVLDQNSLTEYKNTATDTVHKMSRTIDDFRNFFRPNHPEETFSLLVPIQEASNLIDASMQNNAIAVTVDCAEDIKAFGSSNEFSQVMLNLLANAKDALVERKSPLKTIEVSAHEEGNHAVVFVRDNGGGIPLESMDKIFDPYFTSKESGTGIGLYMTRMIVEQHMHGKITCRNTGDGAEFTLSLPGETGQA